MGYKPRFSSDLIRAPELKVVPQQNSLLRRITPTIILGIIACGVLSFVITFLLGVKGQKWDSEKNRKALINQIHLKTDCPREDIEIIEKFKDLKAVKVKACGKTLKYRYNTDLDWKPIK